MSEKSFSVNSRAHGVESCPLCGRALGSMHIDRHHLVPKSFKGTEQFSIHKICHRKIHATLTERQLYKSYHTWDALRAHEDIRAFIEWVARKDPAFYSRTFSSKTKRR